jgi:hypothetical protein
MKMAKKTVEEKPQAKPATPPAALDRDFTANISGSGNGALMEQMDDFDKEIYADAGLGIDNRASSNITPSISILQPMSPQVLAGPDQIDDARAGDFWIKGANPPIIGGKDGIWFQPAATTEHWFEFVPREQGGGFVARYEAEYDRRGRVIPPEGAVQSEENPNSFSFEETGNNCIHYRHVAGFVWIDGIGLEYVISFKGTGHTVARTWNTKRGQKRFPNGDQMPIYSHLYHLTTIQKSNKKGTWFQIAVSDGTYLKACGEIVGDIRKAKQMGQALALAFKRGEKLPGTPEEYEASDEDGEIINATATDDTQEKDKIPF